MADSTAPLTVDNVPDPASLALPIADAVTLYKGTFLGLRGPGHATSQGDVDDYDDTPGLIFGGIAPNPNGLASATGDSSGTPVPSVGLDLLPRILKSVTVTGASAASDVSAYVYATDNQTLTLTRPSDDAEVAGWIVKWHIGTTCDVLLGGLLTQFLLGAMGGNRTIMELGHYDHATLAAGDLLTGFPAPYHGKFVSLHGFVELAFTGAGGTANLNLEIGGTNVTGGALTVSTAAGGTVGTKLDATAITAANEFHEGDLIDLEVASNSGTQTAGRVRVYAVVERLPGT